MPREACKHVKLLYIELSDGLDFICLITSLLSSYLLCLLDPVQRSILPLIKLSTVPNASLDCVTCCVVRQRIFACFVGLLS